MKWRRQSIVMWLVALGFSALVLTTFRSREPHYDGEPLSFWLQELERSSDRTSERWQHAARAVRQIGSKALPTLLQMLQTPDSTWKMQAVDWLRENADLNLTETLGSVRSRRAIAGFRLLGPVAAPALPQLAALARHQDPRVSSRALEALAEVGGEPVLPTLLTVLTNGPSGTRAQAAASLGAQRSRAAFAVPALAAALTAADAELRSAAARGLGEIALDAPRCVPALTRALSDSNSTVRMAAAMALSAFGDQAAIALPAVQKLADQTNDFGARFLTRAVSRLRCEIRDGAIIRGPKTERRLAFVFTGHEFAEGGATILDELAKHDGHASFFLTGVFLANSNHSTLLQRMLEEQHYIGPHSDQHLLYCAWEDRHTLLSETDFATDLLANVAKLPQSPGEGRRFSRYFLPAFEQYNREIADWTRQHRWTLVNYTPGTRSHADYTGEAEPNFVSSQAIFESIVRREREDPNGLNGFLLLLHLGSGPGRADKFHFRFGELLHHLADKGYEFVRVDQLLGGPRPPETK